MLNLIKERKRKKMTQEELGQAVGVSRNMIARYENDTSKPSVDTVKKLSEVLDVTIDLLLKE